MKINDTIEFSRLPELEEKIKVKIVDLTIYNSFKELIDNNNINNFGYPKEYDHQKLLNGIYNIYTPEQEKEYKVLGINI